MPVGVFLVLFLAASFVFRHRSRQFVSRLFNYEPKPQVEQRNSVSVQMNNPTATATAAAASMSSGASTESGEASESVEGKPPSKSDPGSEKSTGSDHVPNGPMIPGDTTARDEPGSAHNRDQKTTTELSSLDIGELLRGDPTLRVLVLGDQLVVVDSDGGSTSNSVEDGRRAELTTAQVHEVRSSFFVSG